MDNGLTFAQIVAAEVEKTAKATGKPVPMPVLDPETTPVYAPAEIVRGRGRGSKPPSRNRRKQRSTRVAIHWMVEAAMRPIGKPKASSSTKVHSGASASITANRELVTNIRPRFRHYA
jgi:hypothetical protein